MSRQALSSRMGQIGVNTRRLLLGIAVLAPIALAPASAAPPDTGLGPNARLVSDDELGDMRGRFIEPENVNFFGIELASAWQTSDGVVLTATLQFEANFNNGQPLPGPMVLASYTHDCVCGDPGLEIGGNITAEFGAVGLTTIDGAVQSNQIGGDDNNVANLLRIRIGDFNANSAGFENTGDVITQSVTYKSPADGSAITFTVEPNAIGVAIQGPTSQGPNGLVMQGVDGTAANQIAQHVQLMGDANTVYNTLDVVIGVDKLQTQQAAVENALSVLKGWGF